MISQLGRPRFVSLASFAINECLYLHLLKPTHLDYRVALGIVLVTVATFTFASSRFWVFAPAL